MSDDTDDEYAKQDFMVKRSVMKSNIFQYDNFKARWFRLYKKSLRYYEGSLEKGPGKEKGRIALSSIKVVEEADLTVIDENKMFGFQVWYEESNNGAGSRKNLRKLYISATTQGMRGEWIAAICKECVAKHAEFFNKHHPGVWTPKMGQYVCCEQMSKDAPGCRNSTCSALRPLSNNASPIPKKKSPTPDHRRSPNPPKRKDEAVVAAPRSDQRTTALRPDQRATPTSKNDPVVGNLLGLDVEQPAQVQVPPHPAPTAPTPRLQKYVRVLYDYNSASPDDLNIAKGEKLEIIDDTAEQFWWQAKNSDSIVGFIPYNYVEEITSSAVESYPWFFPEMSRQRSELLLKEDGREGVFLVRTSHNANCYTVGIFTKEGRGDCGIVKHYHIKINDRGEHYLSDIHPQSAIPELIAYHSQNSGGLITRLRFYPNEKPAPPTVGLSHGLMVVDIKDLQMVKRLGKGNFGEVWKAKYQGRTDVAVKMTLPNLVNDYDFVEEAKFMMVLQNDHLVQMYGVCYKPDLLIVTEYMEEGSLLDYLKKKKSQLLLQPNTCIDIVRQVCEGMAYLESRSFIHRDLAARNCLVGSGVYGYQVKVADFGLSRHVIDDEYTSSIGAKFPIRWSAPEVLLFTRFSSKSDVWAFGVLMWEVFTGGEIPYHHLHRNQDVADHVSQKKRCLSCPAACPSSVYQNIMLKCLQYKEDERPKFSELVELLVLKWG